MNDLDKRQAFFDMMAKLDPAQTELLVDMHVDEATLFVSILINIHELQSEILELKDLLQAKDKLQ